ncbi:MAG: NAD(P)-dependent oxidoreductase [Fluviicola sp. XM-24bin1]|nr:MAG: NAD(P)-dependent oxidoreductase [Fluviicola sp. XM-24bin1]
MNSTALITGATAGFGEACAHEFASNGWNLIITGRREERLTALKSEIESKFDVSVLTLCFDVRDNDTVNKAIDSIPSDVRSQVHLLINNAGLAVGKGPIDEGIIDDWERMIDTNVKGLLYVSKAVIPMLKENGSGQIINIASIAGKQVYPGGNVYCASKHAVDALSQAMRIDLVSHGIKVTNIAPGAAETEFSIVRFKGDQNAADSVYNGYQPLVAKDIAETAYFAATRPPHVTLNDIVIMPTAQASPAVLYKSEV